MISCAKIIFWLVHVYKPFVCSFGCMLGVILLLENKYTPKLQFSCRLCQVFLQVFPLFYSIHVVFYLYKHSCACCWEVSKQHNTVTTMLHSRDDVFLIICIVRSTSNIAPSPMAKNLNFALIRQQNLLPIDVRPGKQLYIQSLPSQPFLLVALSEES